MVTVIVTMADKTAFGFNKYNFGIRSGFKKKTNNFSYFVNWNRLSKFQFNILRVEKHFAWPAYFRKVSQNRLAIKNNLCNSYYIFARFMKNILDATNFDVKKHHNSNKFIE